MYGVNHPPKPAVSKVPQRGDAEQFIPWGLLKNVTFSEYLSDPGVHHTGSERGSDRSRDGQSLRPEPPFNLYFIYGLYKLGQAYAGLPEINI